MTEELKESGTVTTLSVIGIVFGLIGMLGSFIPCIGALAFYIGIPAALISGIALGIAFTQNAKRTFAIVALTISLIGVVISAWQYFSIISAGKRAERNLIKVFQREEPAKTVITQRKPSETKAITPKKKTIITPPIPLLSLDKAKQRIPDILKEIYQELDQGNPRAVGSFIASEISSNPRMLDTICKPFTYRAHYIESIIERPGNKFEARMRVLFQPIEESAQILTFRVEVNRLVLEGVSLYLENWFSIWKEEAIEIARNFYYALKADRQNVLDSLISFPLVLSPEFTSQIGASPVKSYSEFQKRIQSEGAIKSTNAKIIPYKGLKVLVRFSCESSGMATTWEIYVDNIDEEYKIVKWQFKDWMWGARGEDPNIELYTLRRFGIRMKPSQNNALSKKYGRR